MEGLSGYLARREDLNWVLRTSVKDWTGDCGPRIPVLGRWGPKDSWGSQAREFS